MPGGDMISYNYASIQECVAEMRKVLTDVESELEQVKGQRRQLVENGFKGDAASGYDQKAEGIDRVCEELKGDVDNLGQQVNMMADQMRDADRKAGGQFM